MKLTENGLNRLVENTIRCSMDGCWSVRPIGPAQVYALKSFEFDSSDFAGAVVLTVEEAKQALGCIAMSRAIADDIEGKDRELQLKLQDRIEQSEKKKWTNLKNLPMPKIAFVSLVNELRKLL